MNSYEIEKLIWTEEDFGRMGWHDVRIHAIAVRRDVYEILFDIDYILEWTDPNASDGSYRFWVAPATLVFKNVYDASFDLKPSDGICVSDISRSIPGKPRNAEIIGRNVDWLWSIDCVEGEISLRSTGFDQVIRKQPVLSGKQFLSESERGGFSFSLIPGKNDIRVNQ